MSGAAGLEIVRLGWTVPDRVVTNDDIVEAGALRMRASWIEKMVGVRERRWVRDGTAASDLAVEAIRKLALDRDRFRGALFVSTVSPDHMTPSTAAIVKRKLGWSHQAPAIDVSAACAGLVFALELAAHRLKASPGEHDVVVAATETRSRFLNPKDRRTVFLFGDGACALHVRAPREQHEHDGDAAAPLATIEWIETATTPSDEIEILVPAGGSAEPLSESALANGRHFITMVDGPKIVEAATRLLVAYVHEVLARHGTRVDDYGFVVFHQGNGALVRRLCEALGVPLERTWIDFDRFGNTSSASVGIALAEAAERGAIPPGARVLLVAMGAGHHVGVASVAWGRGA